MKHSSAVTLLVASMCAANVFAAIPCNEGDVAPKRPIAVTPVWPMRHQTYGLANMTQFGQLVHQEVEINWVYDYVENRLMEKWGSVHSGQYPYPNSTADYNGTAGFYDMYLDYFKICLRMDFGMGIPRPDSFVPQISGGNLTGRECYRGFWADHYKVPLGGMFGDFNAWFHIDTLFPLEFQGMSIPTIIANFVHDNTVPFFEYDETKLPAINGKDVIENPKNSHKFFPDYVNSWSKIDNLFVNFIKLRGKCIKVPVPIPGQSIKIEGDDKLSSVLMNEEVQDLQLKFEMAKIATKDVHDWARFHILRGHSIAIMNKVSELLHQAEEQGSSFLN